GACPRRALGPELPGDPHAREGRLDRLYAGRGAGKDRADGRGQPLPASSRTLPELSAPGRTWRPARLGGSSCGRRGLFSRPFAQARARVRIRVPEVRPGLLPAVQAAGGKRPAVLVVRPRVPQEGRRLYRDEAPEAR